MTRYGWPIAFGLSVASGSAAHAHDARFRIEIPASDLTDALATLSARTGASVGLDAYPRGVRSAAVRGRRTVAEALVAMLAPTPLEAERIGATIWRLVPRRKRRMETAVAQPALPDILVTARKLPEALSRIATPIAVYVPVETGGGVGTSNGVRDVASAVEGLSVTNLGPGRERPFIRGIADSPFNGFGQTTVSVNIDDARVTYDAPEPGLRLVDIARVEVLKGPQGPLYGTGALGGVYRIVTNRPVPGALDGATTFSMTHVAGGHLDADASGMVNLPLLDGRAALRVVAYAQTQEGWVRDAARPDAINDSSTIGLRAAVRVVPAAGWTIDLGTMRQRIRLRDSQYIDRDAEDLTRAARLPEPSSSRFTLMNGAISGPIGTVRLTVAISHAWQDRDETYDVTPAAAALGYAGARTYLDRRRHRVLDQEIRLASAEGRGFAWTIGASYLSATTYATGSLLDGDARTLPFAFLLHRAASETAAFADGSVELLPRLRAGLGARVFRATTEDERSEDLGMAVIARDTSGVTPSGSLTYSFARDRTVYIRFGTAFRPGGLDPANAVTRRYDSDELRSIDIGSRFLLDGGRLSLSGGGFRSSWRHVQSDYLLPDGLIATRNAGDAIILGAEGSAAWRRGDWSVRAGVTAQHATLENAADGTDPPADRRLPIVPDLAGRIEIARSVRVGGTRTVFALRGTYTGDAQLSFDDGLDRRTTAYALLHADATTMIGGLDLRIGAQNLLNARADSFSFGNPFRIRTEFEHTPLRPRTVTIALARRF